MQQISPESAYLVAAETAYAGLGGLSRSQLATPAEMDSTVNYLNHALEQNGCARRFGADVLRKNWEDLTPQDLAAVAACGSKQDDTQAPADDQQGAEETSLVDAAKAEGETEAEQPMAAWEKELLTNEAPAEASAEAAAPAAAEGENEAADVTVAESELGEPPAKKPKK